MSLNKHLESPNSQNLIFTSAGDNSNLYCWLKGRKNFDLWVSYYGDETNRYENNSDYYIEKKAGKFPALYYAYQHWGDILKKYKAILVMDDDIIISGDDISRLFEIRDQYDLWLLQSAFEPSGKISHSATEVKPFTFMRYTNFVEVTCPLFRKDKLDDFMKVYDPVLIGWGVDWWFMEFLARDIRGRVAVIDEISCINPHDKMKSGKREIDLLQETSTRIKVWESIKEKYNIQSEERGIVEFDSIESSLSLSNILRAIRLSLYRVKKITAKDFYRAVRRDV